MDATEKPHLGANPAFDTLVPTDSTSSGIGQDLSPSPPENYENPYDTGDEYYRHPDFWKPRIQQLCKTTWPTAQCTVSFLTKGKDHTTFLLCIQDIQDQVQFHQDYVLSLPEDDDTVESEAKTLQYLSHRIADYPFNRHAPFSSMHSQRFLPALQILKVPEVVQWDATKDNELKYPYIITKRLPGTNLGKLWDSLTQDQRISIVVKVALLHMEFMCISHSHPEMHPSHVNDDTTRAAVTAFPEHRKKFSAIIKQSSDVGTGLHNTVDLSNSGLSVRDKICASMRRWAPEFREGLSTGFSPSISRTAEVNDRRTLYDLVHALEKEELVSIFEDTSRNTSIQYLYHANLSLDNIMVSFDKEGEPSVTGILGWEEPLFGPLFMSAKPPCWLWQTRRRPQAQEVESLGLEWRTRRLLQAQEVELWGLEWGEHATSRENWHIQHVFDYITTAQWKADAYSPDRRLFRRILRLCMVDKWGAQHHHEVEDIRTALEEHRD
jgi:hypothetical protein